MGSNLTDHGQQTLVVWTGKSDHAMERGRGEYADRRGFIPSHATVYVARSRGAVADERETITGAAFLSLVVEGVQSVRVRRRQVLRKRAKRYLAFEPTKALSV